MCVYIYIYIKSNNMYNCDATKTYVAQYHKINQKSKRFQFYICYKL